jgi:hypothetical protein
MGPSTHDSQTKEMEAFSAANQVVQVGPHGRRLTGNYAFCQPGICRFPSPVRCHPPSHRAASRFAGVLASRVGSGSEDARLNENEKIGWRKRVSRLKEYHPREMCSGHVTQSCCFAEVHIFGTRSEPATSAIGLSRNAASAVMENTPFPCGMVGQARAENMEASRIDGPRYM